MPKNTSINSVREPAEGRSASEEFRTAVADVRPLAAQGRRMPHARRPAPIPRQTRSDERLVLAESLGGPISVDDVLETGEELVYLRTGLPRILLRRLRRGDWVMQDELDLHGMNRVEAAARMGEFLAGCVARRLRCVRIVHGKGLGSRNKEPVLKAKLKKWLPQREEVLAFCQAPAALGGGGALLVLLLARRR